MSARTLGILGIISGVTGFFLLISPYYFLGGQQYIPKSNPYLGYHLPKSLEAWLLFVLALSLLVFSMIVLAFFIQRKKSEETGKKGIPKKVVI